MVGRPLAIYLNDHLAGSTLALELLEHLERHQAGTSLAAFAAQLRADIGADRGELEALMARLQVSASLPRRAGAWLSEKLAELKLRLDDPTGGALHLLEVLDAVSVGIEGKRLLWRALAAVAGDTPCLLGPDYSRLEQRAEEQRQRVEARRLEGARQALTSPP